MAPLWAPSPFISALCIVAVPPHCRAPLDDALPWPVGSYGSEAEGDHMPGMLLPPAQDAYRFVLGHSADDEDDLLPGLCLFTELWLLKVRFASHVMQVMQCASARMR